jgi:hypothetical protein
MFMTELLTVSHVLLPHSSQAQDDDKSSSVNLAMFDREDEKSSSVDLKIFNTDDSNASGIDDCCHHIENVSTNI